MQLTYHFSLQKSVQAMAFMAARIGKIDKIKLLKLVYLADREHFISSGSPITGDRQVAMPFGPVPSRTLDAINGLLPESDREFFRFFSVSNREITLLSSPGEANLSAEEIKTLEKVLHQHGSKKSWTLANETHRLPEYLSCFQEGTSTTIPYEIIARISGDKRRFRNGRPVIPAEALASMRCPIGPGDDL